jgi:hypothetical protein
MRPTDPAPTAAASMPINPPSLIARDGSSQAAQRGPVTLKNGPLHSDEQDTIRRAEGRSPDGEVRFFLQRIAGALYVEREEVPRLGTRTIQSLVFDDWCSFERWCSDDPTRFCQPLLHAQLKRDGEVLWQHHG